MYANLVEIFYSVDEPRRARRSQFCKEIEKTMEGHHLVEESTKKRRKRAFIMSDSEVITIMIMFHQGRYRDLKSYYIHHIQQHCQRDFPHTVSYNRFVELQQKALLPTNGLRYGGTGSSSSFKVSMQPECKHFFYWTSKWHRSQSEQSQGSQELLFFKGLGHTPCGDVLDNVQL